MRRGGCSVHTEVTASGSAVYNLRALLMAAKESIALYSAIKQRFIRYCTNCKEIVKAAEGCGPLRPSCKVRDQNCGAVVSRSFYIAELL